MNRMIIYLTIIAVVALTACGRKNHESSTKEKEDISGCIAKNSVLHQLKGSWDWIETAYFSEQYGKLTKTPQNTGKSLTYTFDNDSLIISSQGVVVEKARFEIGELKDITSFPQDTTLIIRLFNTKNNHKISLLHILGNDIILMNSYNSQGGNVKLRREG